MILQRFCRFNKKERGIFGRCKTLKFAKQKNGETLQTIKEHIRFALGAAEKEENSIDIEFRIAQIDAEFNSMIDTASADTMDGFDENRIQQLLKEKNELQEKLRLIHKEKDSQKITQARLDSICTVIDGLKNCPMAYNDEVVRKLIECVVIESKDQIKVVFRDGMEMKQTLRRESIDFLPDMGQMRMHVYVKGNDSA